MARFHHVNLGVLPGGTDSVGDFLTGILDYRRIEVTPDLKARGVLWYETEDGSQVHLSVDPDHRPAARAHTAIHVGEETTVIEARLDAAGIPYSVVTIDGVRAVFCNDPAGNRWELRS
ncbi:Glyoxalase [Frankia sp. Hr75.2]|nr:Glyoxalase [Frankia sp. Hr75.2]